MGYFDVLLARAEVGVEPIVRAADQLSDASIESDLDAEQAGDERDIGAASPPGRIDDAPRNDGSAPDEPAARPAPRPSAPQDPPPEPAPAIESPRPVDHLDRRARSDTPEPQPPETPQIVMPPPQLPPINPRIDPEEPGEPATAVLPPSSEPSVVEPRLVPQAEVVAVDAAVASLAGTIVPAQSATSDPDVVLPAAGAVPSNVSISIGRIVVQTPANTQSRAPASRVDADPGRNPTIDSLADYLRRRQG